MNYTKIINKTRKNIFDYYDISENKGIKATNLIKLVKRNRLIFDKEYIKEINKNYSKKQDSLLFRTA
tara:strand:+ start:221 stop:421 length:201 start_codon:yes stop_codon:yes gene_type:complete